jgi:atypical dual specificity phosphatase
VSRADAGGATGEGGNAPELSWFHRTFDRFYPLIRVFHERVRGNPWFSEITPRLWLGGAPDTAEDYAFLLEHGIDAVLNIRAEREDDTAWYERHGIRHLQLRVPDMGVPDAAVIEQAVAWITAQIADGRTVLVHCAKGRGRSATLLAAYLMAAQSLSYDEARTLLHSRRRLTKLEERHRRELAIWWAARRPEAGARPAAATNAQRVKSNENVTGGGS